MGVIISTFLTISIQISSLPVRVPFLSTPCHPFVLLKTCNCPFAATTLNMFRDFLYMSYAEKKFINLIYHPAFTFADSHGDVDVREKD